ncbi:phage tail-collar fiber domain-containing protein, partial [Vibrio cincinnatiensis]
MSQTTIPLQFEQYLLDKITAGAAPNLDEFVFAYIPNLDPEQPIDRATGLPDESFIVHRQNVDQTARLNRNTLIYSVIVPSNVAPFTFNAMYLHDKNVPDSCGLIVHKTDETKESGMATTKSVAQEYDGAAEIVGIHIDPATWQIDYHARLFGIDEEIRLTQLDKYGHTAFISGFNVVKLTSNDYRIDPGIVYVGGLRCELKTAVTRTVTAKPNGLYVDVVREGSTLSKWENVPTIKVSNVLLTDYVDEQGYQHYVTRLAGVDASGNVQDWREWDIVSQTEAEEGTSAIRRFWSALRITQLISAWWNRSAMKTKLDGIQAGAQVNVATNLATTADATSRTVTSSTGTNAVLPAATTTVAGVMTGSDKAKLNGIQAGAQVNVATNLATTADATSRTVTSSTGA